MSPIKKKVDKLFYGKNYSSVLFNNILLLISASVIVLVVSSSFFPKNQTIIFIELTLGVFFIMEYLLRFWVSRDRKKFVFGILGIVDVIVIVSLIMPSLIANLGFLKVLRSLQILRLYKMSGTLKRHKRSLFLVRNKEIVEGVLNFVVFLLLMSSLVYSFQAQINPNINNYLDAVYYTVATVTTTGFGDITPQGWEGKLLAIIIMTLGLTFFLKLARSIFRKPKTDYVCPDCGLQKHDLDAIHCKHCGHVIKNTELDELD